jgi:hypothetical protein
MVGLVEAMRTAGGLRLTAYGPDEDEIRAVEGAADSSLSPAGRVDCGHLCRGM